MLVLARKADESLEFPELGVVIRVISLKKSKVHLGIDAPQRIKVRRTELPPPSSESGPGSSERKRSSERKPTAKSLRRCFESHRLSHELSRLESQIAALSELASRANRELAEQVAADSQKQIDRINELLLLVSDSQSGDATVQSRSQDSVRSTSPAIADSCVRQSSVEYVVGDSKQADDAEPIYQLISERAVWFPGLFSEPDRAIA